MADIEAELQAASHAERGIVSTPEATQVAAAPRALDNVALLLRDDHLDHGVRDAAARGGAEADEKLAEASAAIARLVRS